MSIMECHQKLGPWGCAASKMLMGGHMVKGPLDTNFMIKEHQNMDLLCDNSNGIPLNAGLLGLLWFPTSLDASPRKSCV